MTKLFLGSFFNNNNKPYFTKDNDYWTWKHGEQ
jgi:hypothetical protein